MVNGKKGAWIQTFTGKRFDPLNPHFDSLCIEDMAHSLSLINRFMGHTRVPYPVAQHCIIGSKWFEKQGRLREAGLFLVHEPDEPYIGDLPTPIKYLKQMNPYRILGKGIKEKWMLKLEIDEFPTSIKELDTRLLVAEYKALFDYQDPEWLESFKDIKTDDLVIKPYSNWRTAEKNFLKQYDKLFDKRV